MFPPREKETEDGTGRRRSSVWSKFTPSPGSSPSDRRNSILSIFKGSGNSETEPVEFKKVDMGGDRRVTDA